MGRVSEVFLGVVLMPAAVLVMVIALVMKAYVVAGVFLAVAVIAMVFEGVLRGKAAPEAEYFELSVDEVDPNIRQTAGIAKRERRS